MRRPCFAPGCKYLTTERYCVEEHSHLRAKRDTRPSAARRGYGRRWQRERAEYLRANPWCVGARHRGKRVRASIVDHIKPHRGDEALFWNRENWQSLCRTCHDSWKRSLENAERGERAVIPHDLRPSGVPVVIVCGPPGAGKTTYVRKHAGAGDRVIDLDAIRAELAGGRVLHGGKEFLARGLKERDRRLRALADATTGRAFFVVSAPLASERAAWERCLKASRVVVLETDARTCERRIRSRDARNADTLADVVARWWALYEPRRGETRVRRGRAEASNRMFSGGVGSDLGHQDFKSVRVFQEKKRPDPENPFLLA